MSRSTYIYVVQGIDGVTLGAFTVKHELARALERHPDLGLVEVTRTRDGYLLAGSDRVKLNPRTLEPAV